MNEIMVKIMVELFSTFALATNELTQGRLSESLFADICRYSVQHSQICKGRIRREGSRDRPQEAVSTHTRRGSDYCNSDSRGHPQSRPEHEGSHGR